MCCCLCWLGVHGTGQSVLSCLFVLRDLYTVTNSIPDGQMLWAVMTMAFYGCLRASEFTISGVFDPNINLCIQDVTFYSDNEHKYMSVLIKRSKTDVSNKGFTIYIRCVADLGCGWSGDK